MKRKAKPPFRIPHVLLRFMLTGQWREKPCAHLHLIQRITPTVDVCLECVALRDTWPALRMCLICGYVGCCDQAKNQHARKHFEATEHPLMRSIEPGEDWMWCYVDKALLRVPQRV